MDYWFKHARILLGLLAAGVLGFLILPLLLSQDSSVAAALTPSVSPNAAFLSQHPFLDKANIKKKYVFSGDQSFPPYEFLDRNGQPAGFNVDLLRAVAEVMDLNIDIQLRPWDQARHDLASGRVDGLTGMLYSPLRENEANFTSPHSILVPGLFVRRESPVQSIDDIAGHTILVESGDLMHDWLVAQPQTVNLVTAANPLDALRRLSSGAEDGVLISSKVQGLYLIEQYGLSNLKLIETGLPGNEYSFAVSHQDNDLLLALNEGLNIVHATGRYKAIHDRWFARYEQEQIWANVKYLAYGLTVVAISLLITLLWIKSLRTQVGRKSDELRKFDEKYRLLVERASEGICVVKSQVIIFANSKALEIGGITTQTALPRRYIDLIHPDDRERVLLKFENPLAPQTFEDEIPLRLVRPDGDIRWVIVSRTLTEWEGEPAVLALVTDTTEQRAIAIALQESEALTRYIIKHSPNAVSVLDKELRFVMVSDRYLKENDLCLEDIQGRRIAEAFPGYAEKWTQVYHRVLQGAVEHAEEDSFVDANGATQYTRWECRPWYNATGEISGVVAYTEIITARKNAEKQIQSQLQYLTALRTIDLAITSSLELDFTLKILLEQTINQLQVDAAVAFVYHPSLQALRHAANQGLKKDGLKNTYLRLNGSIAGKTVQQKASIYIPDIRRVEPGFNFTEHLLEEGFISYFAMPLISKGSVKGVLELFHRSAMRQDPVWMNYLETLAGQAAIAIENATLFQDLQQANQDLTLAYDATIEGWAHALELRDMETKGHSQRVPEMTLEIAAEMGFRRDELVHIRRGALLHDIGKMGIPDHILLKKGPLTATEWQIMRKHPIYAYRLLAPIVFLRPALDIPYCHHEKWDGSGYPRGLKGEEIPLAARIFSLVDVWDALHSDRPYRQAWPEEKIWDYIYQQTGQHFDPAVVDVFTRMYRKSPPSGTEESGSN
ncbi:MAG: transporter substrate-binding domain-containing protein [Anaerolineaceae bacterium]|nr:transporter substrate-binding domain-containing protein [Anaerolineaceae bacterium]